MPVGCTQRMLLGRFEIVDFLRVSPQERSFGPDDESSRRPIVVATTELNDAEPRVPAVKRDDAPIFAITDVTEDPE